MKQVRKSYLQLFLLLCFALSLVSIFPTPALSHQHDATCIENNAQVVPMVANYIGNSNTSKFHYSSCRYVGKMSENHKVYFDSRDEAINAGYVACKGL